MIHKTGSGAFRARLMLGVAVGAGLFWAASAAYAQDLTTPADPGAQDLSDQQDSADQKDVVIVQGFRQSLANSIATKRDSKSIVEAVSAEEIGKLPDVSIAESLGRLPGLATQRVDGRSQVLSIRGLGPDLSTALLNGREQVSTGDNRGVEFDQYPAELLSSAVVYKTPYAGLIGQGLAGTVDLRTIRPLEHDGRIISANARYEFNEDGALNPDSPSGGIRGSATIVDQFANNTLGIALGVAYQSTPSQSERFNSWGYPTTTNGGPFVIGGSKPFVQSTDLDRVGVIGTVEYAPTDKLTSTVDFYYSDFKERQRLRGVELPLFWSAAQLQPGFTVDDGLVTDGTYTDVVGVVRNDYNRRDSDLVAAGWNTKYAFSDKWALEADVSYSRAKRRDQLIESYSGTGYALSGAHDTLGFSVKGDGVTQFSPTLDYSDPSQFVLTDPQGWGAGSGVVQAGFINAPDTKDELTHLRSSLTRSFAGGVLSDIQVGVDVSRRDKNRQIDQTFLTLPGGAQEAPIPQEALLGNSVDLGFIGIPALYTYDPLYLLNHGVYDRTSVALSSVSVPQDWKVREDVLVGYTRFDVDSSLAGVPVTGNLGVQVVYTDQSSSGFKVASGGASSGSLGVQFVPVEEGDKYTRVLPSLNLIFSLTDSTQLRFGAARTLARARMDQLNASLSLSGNLTRLTSTDPNQSFFSASGGNPELKPTIANSVDLSLEHYFSAAGYISIAGFYKNLQDFVNPNDAFLFDFSDFVDSSLTPAQQAQLGTTLGTVSGPTNRGDGNIRGVEASLSLPGELFSERLEGFGFLTSASYTDSKVLLGDSTDPITVPGLSKWVVNSTAYFERSGFEARISHRYRSSFLAEVSGISATRILRTSRSESIFDAQLGYTFSGALEGLKVVLQANNLTDEPFVTVDSQDPRLVIDHQRYGRSYLIGASYTF